MKKTPAWLQTRAGDLLGQRLSQTIGELQAGATNEFRKVRAEISSRHEANDSGRSKFYSSFVPENDTWWAEQVKLI